MKENIKIGLLGLIALTLVVDVFFMDDSPSKKEALETVVPQSNIAASPSPNNLINPLTNTPQIQQTPPQPTPRLSETRAKTRHKKHL